MLLLSFSKTWAAPATTTTLTITANGNPVTTLSAGSVVMLSATVTLLGNAVNPGLVNFCEVAATTCTGPRLVGSAQLTKSGIATMKFRPGAGVHSYVAEFVGTGNAGPSSSMSSPLTVSGSGSTSTPVVTLSSSGSPGNYSLLATFAQSGAFPSGSVSFVDTSNADYLFGTASVTSTSGLSFITPAKSATTHEPLSVVVADFNEDGIPDIAVSEIDLSVIDTVGWVQIFLGNGDGTFRAGATLTIGPYPFYLATADFNGDGHADLVAINQGSNPITVLLGNGDGTFQPAPNPPVTGGFGPVAVGDFNGDGIPDILTSVGSTTTSSTVLLLGNGDGTFTSHTINTTSAQDADSIIVGDFNNDGKLDFAVCNKDNINNPGLIGSVNVFLGKGDGTFTQEPSLTTGTYNISMTAGDFNNDGNLDLAVSNQNDGTLSLYFGKGDGTFSTTTIPSIFSPGYLATADFNGDGVSDIAIISSVSGYEDISILLSNGNGTFTSVDGPPTGTNAWASDVGDFNGDGIPDLIDTDSFDQTLTVFLTNPSGAATASISSVSPVGTGTHYAQAIYSGSTSGPLLSNTVPLTAQPVRTTLTMTASAFSISLGQQETLTASLAPDTAQGHEATGNVIFSIGGSSIGSAAIINGSATINTSTLPVGQDVVVATYSGDTNFAASSSNSSTITVSGGTSPVSISLTLSSSAIAIATEHHTTIQLTVKSSGYTGPVSLSTGAVPLWSTLLFTPQSFQISAGATQTCQLYIDTDEILGFKAESARPLMPHTFHQDFVFLALVPCFLLPIGRRRIRSTTVVAIFFLASLGVLSGCSGKQPSATSPGVYVVQIQALAGGTTAAVSSPLTITVTP